jgi:hypothetical protein
VACYLKEPVVIMIYIPLLLIVKYTFTHTFKWYIQVQIVNDRGHDIDVLNNVVPYSRQFTARLVEK